MKFASRFLVASLALAVGGPALVHCSADDAEVNEEDIVGVYNELGLSLRYDEKTGHLQATLRKPLGEGEQLRVRLRAGKITLTSEKELPCDALSPMTSIPTNQDGMYVFDGPPVDKSLFDLLKLYNDPNWATGDVTEAQREQAKNPNAIVEACVVNGSTVRAKLQTNLAYALDVGIKSRNAVTAQAGSIRLAAGDGGVDPLASEITEENVNSMIEYGRLCEEELGEIPFFPKIKDGKYETFDCRDLVANGKNDKKPHRVEGVEGAVIPALVDGVAVEKCSPGQELDANSSSYGCLDKSDNSMFLHPGDNQPGPMVVTAQNSRGTRWVLLCRSVADDGNGMMKTKLFNDIAMLGHNAQTGRTCFFQNSLSSKNNGGAVPHPGDISRSGSLWSDEVQSYCSGSCHSNSAFVHSPWIDGAKRSDGKTIVPRMGEQPDLHISNPSAPYNIVAGDRLGFELPKILVSEQAGPCTNCHTLAKGSTMGSFAEWSVGVGESYTHNLTETGKDFKNSHWMPMNLSGLTEANFASSKYGKALEFIKKCNEDPSASGCKWANVPRGTHNNPKTTR